MVASDNLDRMRLASLVRDYTRLASQPGTADSPELVKVVSGLNTFFWQFVEQLVGDPNRVKAGRLTFEPRERMLVDMGLLDQSLLSNDIPLLLDTLEFELSRPGKPNHYYLSEFLSERFENTLALRQLRHEASDASVEDAYKAYDIDLHRIKTLQRSIYKALEPLIRDLPGVSSEVAKTVVSGRLRDHIDSLSLRYKETGDAEHRKSRDRLIQLHRRILSAARARSNDDRHLKLLDALSELDQAMETELQRMHEPRSSDSTSSARRLAAVGSQRLRMGGGQNMSEEEKQALREFVSREVGVVRSLINLGSIRAGILRAQSVLLSDEQRITKREILQTMALIAEFDRRSVDHLHVVIEPFYGQGFFEWDRNCLIIPLSPLGSAEEAICHAVASYRVLADATQDSHRLQEAYETEVGAKPFADCFARDYCQWILKVGAGQREEMEQASYDFFKKHVGPDIEGVIGPFDVLNLTPDERFQLRKSIKQLSEVGEATFDDHYRMAVVQWKAGDLVEARRHLQSALDLRFDDGRARFSLGLIHMHSRNRVVARATLEEVVQKASSTLWQLYAKEIIDESF